MTTGKALDGKPYAGNPHVRFDEGEVASTATPRRGSLLYKTMMVLAAIASVAIAASPASSGASLEVTRDLTLGADVAYDSVSVTANATLNLNGHSLTVKEVSGSGMVMSAMFDEGVYAKAGLELLSYVESPSDNNTVNCYVDTEYTPTATDRIETKIRTGSVISGNQWILGTYTSGKRMDVYLSNNKLVLHLGDQKATATPAANTVYDVVLDGARSKAVVRQGRTTTEYPIASSAFGPTQSFYLLGAHGTGDGDKQRGARAMRMSCFRVFDASGALKVNMLAAKKGDVVGFYDTVRGKFYQPANGALSPGETISYVALSSAKTPSGNTGVFVDTLSWPTVYDCVDADVTFGSVSGNQGVFSSRYTYGSGSFTCLLGGNHLRFDHFKAIPGGSDSVYTYHCTTEGDETVCTVIESGKRYRIHMDGWTCGFSLNGVPSAVSLGNDMDMVYTNFVLFATADANTKNIANFANDLHMRGFRVTDTNGYVRIDLVPAKLVSDGTVGFYDAARNEFLCPSGGALEAGLELPRDLTSPGGTCWSSRVDSTAATGNSVVGNLFSNNFVYDYTATERFYIGKQDMPWCIDYDFGEGNEKAVNAYRITGGMADRTPVAWEVYGGGASAYATTDDEEDCGWTLLASVSGEPQWGLNEVRTKMFKNDRAFRCYRIKFTEAGLNAYRDLTQLEYFRVEDTDAPGELHIDVPYGSSVTNSALVLAGDLRLVKDGFGEYVSRVGGQLYGGGTDVNAGLFTVGAPLATALALSEDATLGFLVADRNSPPVLTIGAGSVVPSPFNVAVFSDGVSSLPAEGMALTDGMILSGETVTFVNPSDFARRVRIGQDGYLFATGRRGLIISFH